MEAKEKEKRKMKIKNLTRKSGRKKTDGGERERSEERR